MESILAPSHYENYFN